MDDKGSMVAKRHTESNEQIAVIDWIRLQHPRVAECTIHIGNERKSSYYAGYIMKRMGVLSGASDLFIAWPNAEFHGLFIEMKSLTGKPSDNQLTFTKRMIEKGYYACFCYGADDAIQVITWYLSQP